MKTVDFKVGNKRRLHFYSWDIHYIDFHSEISLFWKQNDIRINIHSYLDSKTKYKHCIIKFVINGNVTDFRLIAGKLGAGARGNMPKIYSDGNFLTFHACISSFEIEEEQWTLSMN